MNSGVRVRGKVLQADMEEMRRLRQMDKDLTVLSVEDQVADAVVAIYAEHVLPGLELDRMAIVADLDRDTVKRAWLRRLERLGNPMRAKRCDKCGAKKPVEDFDTLRESPDGYAAWCRRCWETLLDERRVARATADRRDAIEGHSKSRRYYS